MAAGAARVAVVAVPLLLVVAAAFLAASGAGQGTAARHPSDPALAPDRAGTRPSRAAGGGGAGTTTTPPSAPTRAADVIGAGVTPSPPPGSEPAAGTAPEDDPSGPGAEARSASGPPPTTTGPGAGTTTLAAPPASTTVPPPEAPTGLRGSTACTVIGLLDPEIVLTWSEGGGAGVTGYQILRHGAGAPFAAVAGLPAAATTYSDTVGLGLGTSYWYEVEATGPAGSATSAALKVTTPATCL